LSVLPPETRRVPSLQDFVRDGIKELIVEGEWAPGAHLVEAELANKLGVSRGPVREALRALAFEGWVDLRPRQGAFVHRPSTKEIRDFFSMRELLEVEAARLAAIAGDEENRLGSLIAEATSPTASSDESSLYRANARFHEEVIRIGDNITLKEIWALFESRMRWYYAPLVTTRAPKSWEEHAAIAEAIRRRDPEEAGRLMREHVSITGEAYESLSRGE
jgi:DNA-binding GntR family transcriptional regulator